MRIIIFGVGAEKNTPGVVLTDIEGEIPPVRLSAEHLVDDMLDVATASLLGEPISKGVYHYLCFIVHKGYRVALYGHPLLRGKMIRQHTLEYASALLMRADPPQEEEPCPN